MAVLLSSFQLKYNLLFNTSITRFFVVSGEFSSDKILVFVEIVLLMVEFDHYHATFAPIWYYPSGIVFKLRRIENYVVPTSKCLI